MHRGTFNMIMYRIDFVNIKVVVKEPDADFGFGFGASQVPLKPV